MRLEGSVRAEFPELLLELLDVTVLGRQNFVSGLCAVVVRGRGELT